VTSRAAAPARLAGAGHDDGHVLAVMDDAVVLERKTRRGTQRRRRCVGEGRGVLVGDDRQHPGAVCAAAVSILVIVPAAMADWSRYP
jgi:hypothetical protein